MGLLGTRSPVGGVGAEWDDIAMTASTTPTTASWPESTDEPQHGQQQNGAMRLQRSAVDLFVLTFNCAKNFINVPVFASHLQAALGRNATGLPDLVAFSLQEVAPLSYSFIGSYFLSPYYERFGSALNLAATRLLEGDDLHDPAASWTPHPGSPSPYTLVRAKNVGMTAILLYARDPSSVRRIEEAECGFGAADMGNKGAVGLRVTWSAGRHLNPKQTGGWHDDDDDAETTELTFVATHLAAMEWNLKKRNANWRAIMSGLTFSNPRSALPGVFPAPSRATTPDRSGAGDLPPSQPTPDTPADSVDSSEAEEEDMQPLLHGDGDSESTTPLTPDQRATLQDASIFKPSSHLFIAGDLNYRIASSTPPPLAPFPSFDPSSPDYFPSYLPRDQLTQERLAARAFHGMSEAPINFAPTYKFNIQSDPKGAANEASVRAGNTCNGVPEVPWRFASHRWPGWCDRVLYLDTPSWTGKDKVKVSSYDAFPVLRTSDHRPVFFRASVPVISANAMRAVPREIMDLRDQMGVRGVDPRVRPPVPVDVDAWERRAAARRKEVVVGWTALLWSTGEGAAFMAALLVAVVGGYWLWRVWGN